MNMKTVALSALLLATAVPTVQAQVHQPTPNAPYQCGYTNPNPAMKELNPGISTFQLTSYFGGTLLRGIETYDSTIPRGWDQRKVSFSEPLDIPKIGDQEVIISTRWNFSIDPGGPTCNVTARNFGKTLYFTSCSDGSSRFCTRVW